MRVLFAILAISLGIHSAEPIVLDWGVLLGSLQADPKLQASNERVNLLKRSPGLGVWDDLEVRYQMDGLDLREHKVDLRVTPLGWGERNSYKKYGKARLRKTQAEKDMALSEALYDRYTLAVEWLYRTHQLAHHQTLLKVYEDRIQVHTSLSGTDRFDPRDMVESQQMAVVLQGHILADQNDLQEIEEAFGELVPGMTSIQLDTVGMLSSQELRERLVRFTTKVDSSFPEYKVVMETLKKAQSEQDLVTAAKRNFISFAQIGYAWQFPEQGKRDKTTPIEDLSIGVGFRIPFGDGRAQDIFDSEVNIVDEKAEMMKLRWELSKDANRMSRDIGSLVRQMSVRDSFVAKVDAGSLFTDYAMRSGADPLLLLKARSTALETAWDAEKLRFEAYALYLEMLKLTGVLVRDPGTNHLMSRSLE